MLPFIALEVGLQRLSVCYHRINLCRFVLVRYRGVAAGVHVLCSVSVTTRGKGHWVCS